MLEPAADEAVEALRNDTEVHAEGDNAFAIIVRSKDPAEAAKTANRLAELYIEGNLQVRAGQVTRTRDIITQKLAEMRGELTQAESKVTAFKRANSDSLPELIEARFHQRDEVVQEAFRQGLLLLGAGESAIRFCPPLCVSAEQVETALRILAGVLAGSNPSKLAV